MNAEQGRFDGAPLRVILNHPLTYRGILEGDQIMKDQMKAKLAGFSSSERLKVVNKILHGLGESNISQGQNYWVEILKLVTYRGIDPDAIERGYLDVVANSAVTNETFSGLLDAAGVLGPYLPKRKYKDNPVTKVWTDFAKTSNDEKVLKKVVASVLDLQQVLHPTLLTSSKAMIRRRDILGLYRFGITRKALWDLYTQQGNTIAFKKFQDDCTYLHGLGLRFTRET